MILIFDVETNGLATRKESELNKIESPRLLEIAWRLYDYDKTLQEEKHFFVYHDNLEVTSECFNINGISQEYLQNYGTDFKSILIEFKNVLSRSNILVGHNLEFDISVIQGEFSRQNMMLLLDSKQRICTMKSSTEYCGISSNWGLKYPTLAELFTFIFNELPLNEHSAFNDVKTTSRCFWHLSDNRIVNYFANQPLYQPDKSIRSWSYEPDSLMEI